MLTKKIRTLFLTSIIVWVVQALFLGKEFFQTGEYRNFLFLIPGIMILINVMMSLKNSRINKNHESLEMKFTKFFLVSHILLTGIFIAAKMSSLR